MAMRKDDKKQADSRMDSDDDVRRILIDLDDATKVVVKGDAIIEIGKSLDTFNAVDCGVFRITGSFFSALGEQAAQGKEGISDGVRQLLETEGFSSVSIPPDCRWIDIDTPESYQHAMGNQALFGSGRSVALFPGHDTDR